MEVLIEKKELVKALKKVEKAIPSKPLHPIFEGILLVAYDDTLKITCGDGDLIISTTIKNDEEKEMLEVNRDGKIVVPKMFINISKAMPDGEITLTTSGSNLVVKGGKSRFELITANPDEYPRLPDRIQKPTFTVNGNEFANGLSKTVFATANTEIRPILAGVNIKSNDNGTLTMVATDSHRLCKINNIAYEGEEFGDFTIPEKSAKELIKIIKDTSKINFFINESQVVVKTENDTIYSRLLSGSYPEIDRLIPTSFDTSLTISKDDLLSAIERSSILNDSDNKTIIFDNTTNDEEEKLFETVTITVESELGDSKEEVVIQKTEGERIKIMFSANYMLDALKHIDDSKVSIHFGNSVQPFIVTGTEEKEEYIQLILPVRKY